MSELDLPFGPWKRLISAQWQEYPLAIYSNPENILMLVVFEKNEGKIDGMIVALKKVFMADWQLGKALSQQKKDITSIIKFSSTGINDISFLMVGTIPIYVQYNEESLIAVLPDQFKVLKGLEDTIASAAEATHLKVKDLSQTSQTDIQEILGDPFSIFSLLHPTANLKEQVLKSDIEVTLGVNVQGGLYKVQLDSLKVCQVVGSNKEYNNRSLQIVCESFLANGIPVVVFDYSNAFSGLSVANSDTRNFAKNSMMPIPLGYPYVQFVLGKGIFVDLQFVKPTEFNDAFKLTGTDVGQTIEKAWSASVDKHFLSDLISAISSLKESKDISHFQLTKTIRAIRVIEKTNPSMFGKNSDSDLLVPWRNGIGKVYHVKLDSAYESVSNLFMVSIIRSIPVPTMAGANSTSKVALVFEPDAQLLSSYIIEKLKESLNCQWSIALSASHWLDLSIIDSPTIKIENVDIDAVITISNQKPVKIEVRPTYTQLTVEDKTT